MAYKPFDFGTSYQLGSRGIVGNSSRDVIPAKISPNPATAFNCGPGGRPVKFRIWFTIEETGEKGYIEGIACMKDVQDFANEHGVGIMYSGGAGGSGGSSGSGGGKKEDPTIGEDWMKTWEEQEAERMRRLLQPYEDPRVEKPEWGDKFKDCDPRIVDLMKKVYENLFSKATSSTRQGYNLMDFHPDVYNCLARAWDKIKEIKCGDINEDLNNGTIYDNIKGNYVVTLDPTKYDTASASYINRTNDELAHALVNRLIILASGENCSFQQALSFAILRPGKFATYQAVQGIKDSAKGNSKNSKWACYDYVVIDRTTGKFYPNPYAPTEKCPSENWTPSGNPVYIDSRFIW